MTIVSATGSSGVAVFSNVEGFGPLGIAIEGGYIASRNAGGASVLLLVSVG